MAVRVVGGEGYLPNHRFFFCWWTGCVITSLTGRHLRCRLLRCSSSLWEGEGGFGMAVQYVGERVFIPAFFFFAFLAILAYFLLTLHLSFFVLGG